MKKLGKTYPPDFKVFEDIYLSFYYGAKIGVLGSNGAGKSTLLKIMAGIDQQFVGEARLGHGFTVGFLPQEPQLDPTKDVFGNVDEGVAPTRALGSAARRGQVATPVPGARRGASASPARA